MVSLKDKSWELPTYGIFGLRGMGPINFDPVT